MNSNQRPNSNQQPKAKGAVIDTGAGALLGWWFFEFACWVALGLAAVTILWVLYTPWVSVGEFLVSSDGPLPVVGWIARIPLIGGAISGAMSDTVGWVSKVAMTIINAIQVLCLLSQAGYLTLKPHWTKVVSIGAIISWMIELWVALIKYPVYSGGLAGFMADLPVPTLSYWDGGAVFNVVFLMFLFEASLYFGAVMILALRHNKGRAKAKARTKSSQAGAA